MILDGGIAQEIRALYKSLDDEGKLLTKAQLAACCDTFGKRFGPERLTSLDGEALLDAIHGLQSKDSLVYWLEYKDDDELPGVFGSIAGGSALRYIIYRRKETGTWMTGSPGGQKELSKAAAIEYANRDQLVRGAELLAGLPADAGDPEYKALQEEMDALAPDVSRLAWGHKYFSLLYPDKLDDYHHTDYQRFHLEIQLQGSTLNFHATSYRYLVITSSRAFMEGTGTIGGTGSYGFLVAVIDAASKQSDLLRVKIWNKATGAVVYDNLPGARDGGDATAAMQGSITLH